MSSIYVKLGIIARTNIEVAISDAMIYSKKHDINVEFVFNGVSIFVTPYSNIKEKIEEYKRDIRHWSKSSESKTN